VLGPAWAPMLPVFQVLSAYGLVRSYAAATGTLFQAVGRPDLLTKVSTLQAGLIGALVVPCTLRWDVSGTAVAMVCALTLPQLFATAKVAEILDTTVLQVLAPILRAACAGVPVVILFFVLRELWSRDRIGLLLLRLTAFVAVYAGGTLLLSRPSA